jgi:hypothetical protein
VRGDIGDDTGLEIHDEHVRDRAVKVRWEDGGTSILAPSGGSARIERKKPAAKGKARKKPGAKARA